MTGHLEWSRRAVTPGRNDLHELALRPDPRRERARHNVVGARRANRMRAKQAQVPLVRNSLVTVGVSRSFGRKAAMGSGIGLLVGGLVLLALLL